MKRIGTAELEPLSVSQAMRDLIYRRTAWVGRDLLNSERSLRTALANAYIAGMNDAIDVLNATNSTTDGK